MVLWAWEHYAFSKSTDFFWTEILQWTPGLYNKTPTGAKLYLKKLHETDEKGVGVGRDLLKILEQNWNALT